MAEKYKFIIYNNVTIQKRSTCDVTANAIKS